MGLSDLRRGVLQGQPAAGSGGCPAVRGAAAQPSVGREGAPATDEGHQHRHHRPARLRQQASQKIRQAAPMLYCLYL